MVPVRAHAFMLRCYALLLLLSCSISIVRAAVMKVGAAEAAALLKKGYVYVDVRTPQEFATGHIQGSVNIPYMYLTATGRVINPNFLKEIRTKFPNTKQLLVVGCATGARSAAATALLAPHYQNLAENVSGMQGWLAASLPVVK